MASSIGETRNEEDFVGHLKQTIETNPQAIWIFIHDQLNTHKSEGLVRLVASEGGIEESLLGEKGKRGIAENNGKSGRIFARKESPDKIRLPAKTHELVEPNRDLVFDFGRKNYSNGAVSNQLRN